MNKLIKAFNYYPRVAIWLIFTIADLLGMFGWTSLIQVENINSIIVGNIFSLTILAIILLVNWYWHQRKHNPLD
ncbi:hypothetical protein KTE19_13010 [Lentilactobacillus sp. IMAU92037]|uniref:hypothetical protein n=1 Tax=Lentilactobacillus TaxID=2767893 RepID=UPI001C25BF65|nr:MULTISPECIES: hypothetical protein [Lentilactobacillus]MBU9789158.1 hypothetical protein [Lentilactobacillus dabitei]MBV0931590.1 hypothetical protein [Lentilactobacillus dabitei]MDM7516571.1 hypothetical protein [Lentilactobacillus sp. TOM.63]